MHIFNKEDFENKEAEVYNKIWDIMPSQTFSSSSDFIRSEFL